LGLLVDAEHGCFLGRVQIQAYDVADFLGELRVVADLERARAMRLKTMQLPDAVNRGVAHADRFGHRAGGPVGCSPRLLVQGLVQDLVHDFLGNLRLPSRPWSVLLNASQAVDVEAVAPA
jgi:hypothetical protein